MQLHELQPATKKKLKKRVGRGGAHGTYSTRGMKGQKSRAGSSVRPGFEGGRTPLQKLLPKRRGVGFKKLFTQNSIVTLKVLNEKFKSSETVTPQSLVEKRVIRSMKEKFKILSNGEIDHPLIIERCILSKSAREKVLKAGGRIV